MEFGCIGAPFEVKFAEDDKAPPGAFEGYGAVFGNIDSHGDVIGPGAFAKSLLERERAGRGGPPKHCWWPAPTESRSRRGCPALVCNN